MVNAARRGTRTTLDVSFSDLAAGVAVHAVKVWSSVNGGRTWTALRTSGSGAHWSAVVANPAAAGYVSLRVQGTNAGGFWASVTAIRAYAVR
jgi:hypothetical protein